MALALCSGEQNPEDPHVRIELRDSEDLKVQAVKDAILLKCKDIFSQWSYYTDIQDMAEELTGQVRKEVGAALNRQLPEYQHYATVLVLNSNGYLRETLMTHEDYGFRKIEVNWFSGENEDERGEFGRIGVTVRAVIAKTGSMTNTVMEDEQDAKRLIEKAQNEMNQVVKSNFGEYPKYDNIPGIIDNDATEAQRHLSEVAARIRIYLKQMFLDHEFFLTVYAVNNFGYCQDTLVPVPGGTVMLETSWVSGPCPDDKSVEGTIHVNVRAVLVARYKSTAVAESECGDCVVC